MLRHKNFKNYYLTFLANIFLCLGVAITIGIVYKSYNNIGQSVLDQKAINSIWLGDAAGFILLGISFFYFVRDGLSRKYHVPRRYFIYVYLGYALPLLSIALNISTGFTVRFAPNIDISTRKIILWTCIGIDGLIWVISNAISWYGHASIESKYIKKMTDTGELVAKTKKKDEQTKDDEKSLASSDLKSFL